MGINSWEEDKLFEEWSWEKDLIQRVYRSPDGMIELPFDDVMRATSSGPLGELELKEVVMAYGQRKSVSKEYTADEVKHWENQ